ncbi:uncharacterized protein LOC117110024 [Anneissia japonica]|uniref:uncharacterized protein LOC117110024 n=1 Tax=Anneissia japonica TaxID=1529436 RepID=UPI0014259338|nr:uncharacterized protein LOC117110024 [Anneissia japonica]XP_033108469.1 uncharacterized protein LOC117110024 [Anneissia japonica]XP_033108471.1 uncharacterized protein LOC117110024 [Anneissia japonica]
MAGHTNKITCRMMDELATEFITLEMIGRLAEISVIRIEKETDNNVFRNKVWWPVEFFSVGSKSEGMPEWVRGDIDQMACRPIFPIVLWQSEEKLREGFLMAEQDPNKPVYLKLKVQSNDFKSDPDNDVYLKANDFIKSNQTDLKDYKSVVHGPALATCVDEGYLDSGTPMIDLVYCLKCQSWPPFTSGFFTRDRPNNWPSQELLNKIAGVNCLVVACGHTGSASKNTDWRLSFSIPERELIQEICEPYANCMFVLKAIKNRCFVYSDSDKPTPFCSYFIKTACLWMCETFSHKGYGQMDLIRKVLDWLIECYQNRNLPHYFVPKHNLIGQLKSKCCGDVRTKLEAIKSDLWTEVMNSFDSAKGGSDNSRRYVITFICNILAINRDNEADYTTLKTKLLNHPEATKVIEILVESLRKYRSHHYSLDVTKIAGCDFSVLPTVLANRIQENLDLSDTLKIPMEIMMPIVKNIEVIVPKGYGKMFRTRLYRYLGDVYTYLLVYLQNIGNDESFALYLDTPLHYYKLGGEMVFPCNWSDEGIGGKILVIKYHYLLGNYNELKDVLTEFEPILCRVKQEETYINRLAAIEVHTNILWEISHSAWAIDELLQYLVKSSSYRRMFLHPIALVLYIKARLVLNEGDTYNALEIVKEIEACQNMMMNLFIQKNTNIFLTIINSLVGLIVVSKNIYFSKST